MLESAVIADFDFTDDNTATYSTEVLDAAIFVGEHEVVKECVHRKFFTASWDYSYFTELRRIFRSDYIPTDRDICMCRKPTVGVCDYSFVYNMHDGSPRVVTLVDVGGQKSERRHWENLIQHETDAILYLMSLTDHAKLDSKEKTNDYYSYINGSDLQKSTQNTEVLFQLVFNSEITRHIPVICMHTKTDLFRKLVVTHNNLFDKQIFESFAFTLNKDNTEKAIDHLEQRMAENLTKAANTPFLMEKAKSMPFLRGNLIDREDFVEAFDELWKKVHESEERIERLLDLTRRQAAKHNSLQFVQDNMTTKRARAISRKPANGKLPGSRKGSRASAPPLSLQYTDDSETGKGTRKSLHFRSLRASIGELVSGFNSKNEAAAVAPAYKGINRTSAYHWN